MNQPLVTVIVPTRNSERTLEACLRSVREQTCAPIEISVADRESQDKTGEIAKRWADKVIAAGPERSAQRNAGARAAKGEYLVMIDSDMTLAPKVIEDCVAVMETDRGISAVVIPEESFGKGFWAQCKRLERSFYVGVPWMEAARFFRREDFLAVGGYDEALVSGEDWDLSQRLEVRGRIGRVGAYIFHDEGRLALLNILRKKWYYASEFAKYAGKRQNAAKTAKQTSVYARYGLFLSRPRKLLARPLIGLGMLFMKAGEFGVGGMALLRAKLRPPDVSPTN